MTNDENPRCRVCNSVALEKNYLFYCQSKLCDSVYWNITKTLKKDLKDDKVIEEVQTEFYQARDRTDSLRQGVNATLSDKQKEYLINRQQLRTAQRRLERDRRESVISKRANRLREKELFG